MTGAEINIFSSEFINDPFPTFQKLRSQSPVIWDSSFNSSLAANVGAWHFLGYQEVQMALRDPRFSAHFPRPNLEFFPEAERQMVLELFEHNDKKHMLWVDPPDHTRLRTLANKAFTAQKVQSMRPYIQEITDQLLDAVQVDGQMDVMDLAVQLPIAVTAQLLGVPEEDWARLKVFADNEVAFFAGQIPIATVYESRLEYRDYIRTAIAQRRQQLGDDLLSALIVAQEEGDRLTEDELIGTVHLLFIAGYETTMNLIGNGFLALLKNPHQLHLLRENPSLIKTAVEEFLRYDGPVQFMRRTAKQDLEISGNLIKAQQDVYIWFAAANHDPEKFPRPEEFDITRSDNPHMGFGYGIHLCLGAPLARLETEIAINTILRRFSEFSFASEEYQRNPNPMTRGLKSLPIVFKRA